MKIRNRIKKLYKQYEKKFNTSFFNSKEDLANFCILNLCYLRDSIFCNTIKAAEQDDLLNLINIINQYQQCFNASTKPVDTPESADLAENNFEDIKKEKIKFDLSQTKLWYYLKCYFGGIIK